MLLLLLLLSSCSLQRKLCNSLLLIKSIIINCLTLHIYITAPILQSLFLIGASPRVGLYSTEIQSCIISLLIWNLSILGYNELENTFLLGFLSLANLWKLVVYFIHFLLSLLIGILAPHHLSHTLGRPSHTYRVMVWKGQTSNAITLFLPQGTVYLLTNVIPLIIQLALTKQASINHEKMMKRKN
jgi:hypothetical protein